MNVNSDGQVIISNTIIYFKIRLHKADDIQYD
jgi:hypothetical protein